ncbi:TetR/AcrR family transcriptional regulator [Peribacillus sp. TH27]|uniref:TetR/AcrR family transcriptional regulator n=1 Tax=Peribacillus sp. TH27 TaxID=2798484 RepID=UPI0019125BE8|nr:helix-turn-helix domain-containing protein [Peribacillus sp. TH27]MBK5463314.1 helix-turn-helix transcriptional regulator [Peribacillus sp. TH27]
MKKGQQTKERIINVARTLFASKGFDMTRTNEIASACNVSEATIYKYFDSKKDLLLATITPSEKEDAEVETSHLSTDELVENHVITLIKKFLKIKNSIRYYFEKLNTIKKFLNNMLSKSSSQMLSLLNFRRELILERFTIFPILSYLM